MWVAISKFDSIFRLRPPVENIQQLFIGVFDGALFNVCFAFLLILP